MLKSITIDNYVLIEHLEIDFHKGFSVLTGETGAGKSIIIGSINLALGARADKDMIRTGAEYALVELVFQIMDEDSEKKYNPDIYWILKKIVRQLR